MRQFPSINYYRSREKDPGRSHDILGADAGRKTDLVIYEKLLSRLAEAMRYDRQYCNVTSGNQTVFFW